MSRQTETAALAERVRDIQTSQGLSRRAACREVGVAESTVREYEKRAELLPVAGSEDEVVDPGVRDLGNDNLQIATPPGEQPRFPWTPESLLRAHSLDPDEWSIVRIRGNRWGDTGDPMAQLRVDVIPTTSTLAAANPDDWEPLPAPTAPRHGDRSVVHCTDHHAPHHDPVLHRLFCDYLASEQPDLIVCGGDTGDWATVSRHRDTEGYAQGVKEVNRGAFGILRDYRHACPNAVIILIPGNHDDRLPNYLADNADRIVGIGPAFDEDVPLYSLKRLWRLDELQIDLMDGDYEHAKFQICSSLTARHGYMTSENTGRTMLNKHERSQIQGHSHRLRFTYKTKHDPKTIRCAIEAGCMCIVDEDGLGYTPEPDWQQGFVAGYTWEGGDFALAPHPYIDGRLLCPDGRRFA